MADARRYLILGLVLAGLGRAQPAPAVVRFSVFSLRPVEGLVFSPKPAGGPQPVLFYPTARSPRYEYRGAMPLRFTDAASGAVVAEATVPPEIHDALLLFSAIEP